MQDNTLCRLILISQRYAKQLNINFTPRTHLIFIHVYRISIRIKKKKPFDSFTTHFKHFFNLSPIKRQKHFQKKKLKLQTKGQKKITDF